MIPETERIRRLSADVSDAQSVARGVVERLSRFGDPDAGAAAAMLRELTALSGALHDRVAPPESCAVVSRLLCISARCDGALGVLQLAVNRAATHVWS